MDEQTLNYYNTYASEVVRRYEATAEGMSSLFPFVFKPGETVLEIGAGSGRDAARLQALGAEVDAVEPSAGLRQLALATHPELSGRVHDGFLPGGLPGEIREKYDGILLSAVIMHIPDAELFDTSFSLRERLTKGGKLLVSIPVERGDVSSDSNRDSLGRLMIIKLSRYTRRPVSSAAIPPAPAGAPQPS